MAEAPNAEARSLTWPYEADDGDHFETSEEALQDITFLLRRAAVQRQLSPEELKVAFVPPYSGRGFSGETRGA
eukprot:symbB.v1.2.014198.t1/scaffold981.1/size258483/9